MSLYEPKPWHINGGGDHTNAPNYLTIRIYDAIAPNLGAIKRRRWRAVRTEGLAEWEQSGLKFLVEEKDFLWPDNSTEWNDIAFLNSIDRASIILRRGGDVPRSTGSYTDQYGGSGPDYAMGMILLADRNLVRDPRNVARAVFMHELGHTLGFGHGGNGVMGFGYFPEGSLHVSDEELAIAKEWYKIL